MSSSHYAPHQWEWRINGVRWAVTKEQKFLWSTWTARSKRGTVTASDRLKLRQAIKAKGR
jgi:hypothetical protein